MSYVYEQFHEGDCAVIACFNALIWRGLPLNRMQVAARLKCDADLGTTESRIFEFAVKALNLCNVTHAYDEMISQVLRPNKAALLSYICDDDGEEHLAFFDGKEFPNHLLDGGSNRLEEVWDEDSYALILKH